MATQAQIEANRLNSQRSTGPRTPDGKTTAAQNALRHGLCSGFPLMHDEAESDAHQLLAGLIQDHQPVGVSEEILVYQMAEHFHFQKRASYRLAEEVDAYDSGDKNAREIGLMMRYYTTAVRGFSKALSDLRKLQKERKLQEIGFVSQKVVEAPSEPPISPGEPPKPTPAAATPPIQAPIRVEPTAARPVEARENTQAAPKDSEKSPDGRPHTPPKAA